MNSTPTIRPRPADVADPVVLGGDRAEPGHQLRAADRGVLDESLVADRLEHREPGRAGDRIAAVGRPVGAASPALLEVAARDDGRQRQAVGDRLGDAHDVGHDPGVLERPHPPGPAVARLDLVGDEQDAVLVARGRASRAGTRPVPGRSRPRRGPAR